MLSAKSNPAHPQFARIETIAESEDWIVVNKPAGIEAHPSKPNGRITLWDGLREVLAYELANGGQVSLINRLDRETSGLTLVAKHRAAARDLCRQMEARAIGKEYLAIVWGWPAADEWTVDAPLRRRGEFEPSAIHLMQAVHPDGAGARTRFCVERRMTIETSAGGKFALVRAIPETGRMHQIRVHLAHSGHPVAGDKIYGPDCACYLEFIETGWTPALGKRLLLARHALHSAVLRLSGRGLAFQAPLPGDMQGFLSGSAGHAGPAGAV